MSLKNFSDDELQRELTRRQRGETMPAPKPLKTPNFTHLIETVTYGVEQMQRDQYPDEKLRGYIYEAAIEAIYGKEFWAWRNAKRY